MHPDPKKVARWEKVGRVVQPSSVGWSSHEMHKSVFPWLVTEDFLDASLENIESMRKDVKRKRQAALRKA